MAWARPPHPENGVLRGTRTRAYWGRLDRISGGLLDVIVICFLRTSVPSPARVRSFSFAYIVLGTGPILFIIEQCWYQLILLQDV